LLRAARQSSVRIADRRVDYGSDQKKTRGELLRRGSPFYSLEGNYFFFAEADGDALAAGDAAEPASVPAVTFTVLHSSEPSACFQYEPLTFEFAAISVIVALAPSLVTVVLSVTLKTRLFVFPAIVKVFAVVSTAETVPRNGIARGAFSAGEAAALAAGDALADASGVAFFFLEAANAGAAVRIATAATQAPVIR
jgi:hypothetical protein